MGSFLNFKVSLDTIMLTLLSPAKTLDYDSPVQTEVMTVPGFLDQSAELIDILRGYSVDDVSALMKLSAKLAELNVQRYSDWSVPFPEGPCPPGSPVWCPF